MSEVKAKKGSTLTIEKELLSSYIEAVSDMKTILSGLTIYVNWDRDGEEAEQSIRIANDIIAKHTEKLKSNGIWD